MKWSPTWSSGGRRIDPNTCAWRGSRGERGELVMAGALGEPPGALIVFRAADKSVAEAFATSDPYVTGGLVTKWTVRPWVVVVGQDPAETPPGLPPS